MKRFFLFAAILAGIYGCLGYTHASLPGGSNALKDTLNQNFFVGEGVSMDSFMMPIDADSIIITRSAFQKYKKAYRTQLDTNLIIAKALDSSFSVHTSQALLTFPTEKTIDWNGNFTGKYWATFDGFQGQLKQYFIHAYSVGEFTIGRNLIIDSVNSVSYDLPTMSDGGYDPLPVVSPHQKYIAYYDNNVLGEPAQCNIVVIRIGGSPSKRSFTLYTGMKKENWEIKELVWIGDTALAMRVDPAWQETMQIRANTNIERDTNAFVKISLPKH